LFLKDENAYEKGIADLLKNPDSQIKQQVVQTAIVSHLEDNPKDEENLKQMYEILKNKEGRGESIKIVNSKNVNTGTIHAGGNVVIGDSNSTIHQNHLGAGDNIAGNKITNNP